MADAILTQEQLKAKYSYDNLTGIFKNKYGKIVGNKNSRGYIRIYVNNTEHKAHRLAWLYVYGKFPDNFIDHINLDKSDNRISNLREATNKQNNYNVGISKRNTSGFKGVNYNKRICKWVAQASINNKNKYLGAFDTAEQASMAYLNFIKPIHGEYIFNMTP